MVTRLAVLPASRGRGPQTTWHQASPRGVWLSSGLSSVGVGAKANTAWTQMFGVLWGGRARRQLGLRRLGRANRDRLTALEGRDLEMLG